MNGEGDNDPKNLIAAAIDEAEEMRDPMDGLVEKTATDPGAPFAPDTLERLARLKKEDRAAFEALRAQLKKTGCRVTALDEAIAEENGDTGRRGPTQADILIELAQSAELFHAPDRTGFADLDINGHRETWPIRAKGFRRWLARRFFETTQGAPSSEALQSALNVIDPIAAAVRAVMTTRTEWAGTASALLGALADTAGERVAKSKTWPDSPKALAGRLRRAATFLRKIGIEISFEREGRARTRMIRITTAPNHSSPEYAGVRPSASSALSAPLPISNAANGFAAPDLRTVASDADGGPIQTVRASPLKSNARTGADANRPPQSVPEKTDWLGWRARL